MSLKRRLKSLEGHTGGVVIYGERGDIAALLLKAPAHLTRDEARTLHRYRYEHNAGYRAMSDKPVPIRALEVMLEALVRRDFVTSSGYEDMPAVVSRELLSRNDASLAAKEQARCYLDGSHHEA